MPEFWQPVTGALEYNENFQQAAFREVLEETGIVLNQVDSLDYEYEYPIQPAWRQVYGHEPEVILEKTFYSATTTEPRLSEEHSEFRWVNIDDALALMEFDNYKKGFIQLHALLNV